MEVICKKEKEKENQSDIFFLVLQLYFLGASKMAQQVNVLAEEAGWLEFISQNHHHHQQKLDAAAASTCNLRDRKIAPKLEGQLAWLLKRRQQERPQQDGRKEHHGSCPL